jgi:hypothetical protein
LIARTAAMAAVTLYACCFVNSADMIARKNIALFLENPAKGMDCHYIRALGDHAVPAVREYWPAIGAQCLAFGFPEPQPRGWRDWGFRSWRNGRY